MGASGVAAIDGEIADGEGRDDDDLAALINSHRVSGVRSRLCLSHVRVARLERLPCGRDEAQMAEACQAPHIDGPEVRVT